MSFLCQQSQTDTIISKNLLLILPSVFHCPSNRSPAHKPTSLAEPEVNDTPDTSNKQSTNKASGSPITNGLVFLWSKNKYFSITRITHFTSDSSFLKKPAFLVTSWSELRPSGRGRQQTHRSEVSWVQTPDLAPLLSACYLGRADD